MSKKSLAPTLQLKCLNCSKSLTLQRYGPAINGHVGELENVQEGKVIVDKEGRRMQTDKSWRWFLVIDDVGNASEVFHSLIGARMWKDEHGGEIITVKEA